MFSGVETVRLDKSNSARIVGVRSKEGETLALAKAVVAKGKMEEWMMNLLSAMRATVRRLAASVGTLVVRGGVDTAGLAARFPAQIALLGLQIQWTSAMEGAILAAEESGDRGAMAEAGTVISGALDALRTLAGGHLSTVDRAKVEGLITVQVYQRDAYGEVARSHVSSVRAFEWVKRMRFYADTGDGLEICVGSVPFVYNNEFLGARPRLVMTPLTDRCYSTLAYAHTMHLGGAPFGPAGTGKTETVKDMGATLGNLVVVFNCSDEFDTSDMGRIFKGMAQVG